MQIDWESCRVRLGVVGRSRWARGQDLGHTWEPPGREVEDCLLIVVWSGCGRFRLRQGWVPLRPGVCLWLRPGHRYVARQKPDAPVCQNFFAFELLDARGQPRAPDAPLPPEFVEPPDPEFVEAVSRRIVERCYGFKPMGYASPPFASEVTRLATSMFTTLLMELDAAASPPEADGPPATNPHHERIVRQTVLRISEDPCSTPSVAELARHSHYSVSRFSRIFKYVTGEAPKRFIVRTRLHRGERLLRETDMPVGAIALAAGYRNVYFFSRQFKKFNGVSPLRFRQQHREG